MFGIPLNWIVLGLLGLLAFKGTSTEAAKPGEPVQAQRQLQPLDPGMPADVLHAVWRCYAECRDPAYLRAFSQELLRARFLMGANLLAIRANQLQPPTQAPAAAPAPAVQAPAAQPVPYTHLKAIADLSPEQRSAFMAELSPEQRKQLGDLLEQRKMVKPVEGAAPPAAPVKEATKALPEPSPSFPIVAADRREREPAPLNGAKIPAEAPRTASLDEVKAEG